MGVGGMAWPVYWLVGASVWTLLGCLPFKRRISYFWRMYLALYILVSVVFLISVGPANISLWTMFFIGPGAATALIRLVTQWRSATR